MRIGTNSSYLGLQFKQNTIQNNLNDVMSQMNGLKIQFGYQNTSIYNKTLALDYNITTLYQSKEIALDAKTFSLHTDTALNELTKSMDNFKNKMIQGTTQHHSETSRQAIAKDLKAIRDHFMSLANTSVGNQFLFGGTATTSKPFNPDGSYNGNSGILEALVGSQNKLDYNITGKELFFGQDNDKHRVITTNIPKLNQSELHPKVMNPDHKTGEGTEVYIKATDTIRDMVGDNDADPKNDLDEVFYITGRKADGTPFKSKFPMDTEAPIQDLLDKIGKEFGNTNTNKVVDVTLNEWGEIEIKDLTPGRSNIEFNMISSKWQDPQNTPGNPNAVQGADGVGTQDIDRLLNGGRVDNNGSSPKVNTYVQSPFIAEPNVSAFRTVDSDYDRRVSTVPVTLRTKDNKIADANTPLSEIFGDNVTAIRLNGITGMGADGTTRGTDPYANLPGQGDNFNIAGQTVQGLMDKIKQDFSNQPPAKPIEVELSNGVITITDPNVKVQNPPQSNNPPFVGDRSLFVGFTARDAQDRTVPGFINNYDVEYDRAGFSKRGATLSSNVSQVIRGSNEYANMDTKLSEVAGVDLNGHIYNFSVKDVNGQAIKGEIHFENGRSFFEITSPATIGNPAINLAGIEIPILDPNGTPPQVAGTSTPANDVTYQQLANTLGMVMNLSNSNPADLQRVIAGSTPPNGNFNDPANKAAYESLITNSQQKVNIGLNVDGQLEFKDLSKSPTNMQFVMYDSTSSRFEIGANGRVEGNHPSLTFQANGALIADDPHVNFFKQIDAMIEAMEKDIYRPGGSSEYGDAMRNAGMQNGILQFDHIADHVGKVHTKNGAQGNALDYSIQRTEILITQTKTLRSETIDTDIAETYLKFSTLSMNYQAMLNTVGKISQLTLVNYI